MAKFELGETAIFTGEHGLNSPNMQKRIGEEVEIFEFRGLLNGVQLYGVLNIDGGGCQVIESSLRKRSDDNQQRFQETLKPCDKDFSDDLTIWLRPTETEVKEGLKGILQPFDNHFEGYDP